MNKKILFLSACMLPLAAMAQPQQYGQPFRPLTQEKVFAGKYFELYSKKPDPAEGKKPTLITQRMIASAYRTSNGNAAPELQDSTRYVYSGTRGASPVRAAYNVQTVAEFDTAFSFLKSDNFAIAYPLYGQQFNSNNGLSNSKRYNPAGGITQQYWLSYHTNNNIKNGTSLIGNPAGSDWNYQDMQLNEAGQTMRDTSARMTAGVLQYSVSTTQYGATGRREMTYSENDLSTPGMKDIVRTYFLYNTPSDLLTARDSSISNISSSSVISTATGAYTYDTANRIVDYTRYTEPNHIPSSRTLYVYTPAGKIYSQTQQTYNNTTGAWVNNTLVGYLYTGDYCTMYVYGIWDPAANTFREQLHSEITLNAAGLPDSMKNHISGRIVNLQTWTYDSNKNKTQYGEYNIGNGNINNVLKSDVYNYYYEDYEDGKTGISDRAKNNLDILVYPTPAGNTLHYRVQTGQPTNSLQCRIYDASGRLVLVAASSKKEDAIDVSRLHAGIYFLEIKDREQHLAHRQSFIKQ
ncbi:T9SS type A sorting domain-containing protein [Taibaiella chishuiensis]|uniref:Putative secreted protein (Por secretion system target) n=1 Tax=Taibaiella chishuiensis TaxID=1434707 RepID=A0A2P8D6F7_9BACT|nr:T9SS type A sorting domain-containing protein [Taibaiella chishuiensis]PSK92781.1 putative secreted protein (Por secretion system target) [Taibaiella chishuiensis]